MKTEELKGLGLTDEQIKSVMALHGTDVNALKGQVGQLTTERDGLKQRASDSDKQLNDLKEAHKGDKDFQAEIDKLKADNKAKDDQTAQQLSQAKLSYQTDLGLLKAGALNTKAAAALIDIGKLSLDDKGNVTGLDEQLKALKESDDSKFLFKSADTAPKPKDTPPISPLGNPNPDLNPGDSIVQKVAARLSANK